MNKPNIAIALYGELRTFRISFFDFIELFEKLNKKYNIYLFLCVNMKITIADWKTEEEKTFLNEVFNNEYVILNNTTFNNIINVFNQKVYNLSIINYDEMEIYTKGVCIHRKLLYAKMKILDIVLKKIPIDLYFFTRPDLIFSYDSIKSISLNIDKIILNTTSYVYAWDCLLIIGKDLFEEFIDLKITDINYYKKCVEDFNLTDYVNIYDKNNDELKRHLLFIYFLKKSNFKSLIENCDILRIHNKNIFYNKLDEYIKKSSANDENNL